MKYLGEETEVKVVTKSVRKVEYMRCDGCGKKITPNSWRTKENSYVHIHTWHNDWGNDSCESHEYKDYCKECAKFFVMKYIDEMDGTEELELSYEHIGSNETYDNYKGSYAYDEGYSLVSKDKKEKENDQA